MQYNTVSQLEQRFLRGTLSDQLPLSFTVGDDVYQYKMSTPTTILEMITESKKYVMVYESDTSSNALAFAWDATPNLSMVPIAVRCVELPVIVEGTELGYEESVRIHSIDAGRPIHAKIDTGADMCSLHAENISMSDNTVRFSINGSQYSMAVASTMQVKQADSDSDESRPIVKFTMDIAGKTIQGVECNLNDRTGMTPLLIGKNLLQRGDFTIHTNVSESIDWAVYESPFDNVNIVNQIKSNDEDITKIVEYMLSSNVTLRDVIHHIKQSTIKMMNENIKY